MFTLRNLSFEGVHLHIEDDVRIIGNTRISNGSLTVTGKITLEEDDHLKIENGFLMVSSIRSPIYYDSLSVDGPKQISKDVCIDIHNIS